MTAPIVRQALYLEAADRLRAMIQSRALAAGEWVDELRLAAQLGISRTPLREALKLLASEGLVRLEPRRGCFVNELSPRDLDEIFPLMAMLEGRCAHEAARKAQPQDMARLRGLHDTLQAHAAAGDIDAYYEANYVIHEAIQALADNRWLSDMIGNLRKVLSLSRHKSLALPGRMQASCAEHMAIYAAIVAHDAEGAEALARGHLLRQLDALRVLDAQHPRPVPPPGLALGLAAASAPGLAPAATAAAVAAPAAASAPGLAPAATAAAAAAPVAASAPSLAPAATAGTAAFGAAASVIPPAPHPDIPEPDHERSASASPSARRAHVRQRRHAGPQ